VKLARPLGEPTNVAEDIEKPASYPIEREPGVAVDELVVVHKPVEGMTFRFYGVVADPLKPIVANLDVSIARFTVGQVAHFHADGVESVTDMIAAHDHTAGDVQAAEQSAVVITIGSLPQSGGSKAVGFRPGDFVPECTGWVLLPMRWTVSLFEKTNLYQWLSL
jgi:hypothetical protein